MTFLLLEKLPTIVYIYNVSQLLLASGDNHFNLTIQQQLLTYKCLNTKYISTGGLVCRWACKLRSVIFENIFIHQPLPRFSCGVVLDVGSCYFNVPLKSKLYHTPYAFKLFSYWVFKFPPPMD